MASLRDLRRRIKSIKNTSQITKAMQMVSATKMRRAQIQALNARPYTLTISQVLARLFSQRIEIDHSLNLPNGSLVSMVLLITSDKGLCGALNTNLFRLLQSEEAFKKTGVSFCSYGKKGRDFILRTGRNLEADFESHDQVKFTEAVKIRKFLTRNFLDRNIGQAYILYSRFISTLRQESKVVKLLPINRDSLSMALVSPDSLNSEAINKSKFEFLFEPSIESLLDYSLNHLLDSQIYQALLESKASEHSARMMAMQNATDNAKDLVEDLSLTYNGLRQESITREILEITSAGAALSN